MKTLPGHLQRIAVDVDRAARTLSAQRRRRVRRLQVAALVAATAVLGTSAGLASGRFDVLSWLNEDDPIEVRYLADTTRTYEGAAPMEVECESVRGHSFTCRALPTEYECPPRKRNDYPCGDPKPSQRIYSIDGRVEAAPRVTRERLLEGLDDARDEGMSSDLEDRFRAAIEGVPDTFIARLDLSTRIQGGRTYHEDARGRTPPPGIPMKITCAAPPRSAVLRCRDVAGTTDVPLGAPVYSLSPTADWVRHGNEESPEERWDEVEAFFGRPLSDDELLVLSFFGLADDMTAEEWAQVERALARIEKAQ